MSFSDEIHDPGLQQERTVLAWDRTGLALMVAAGVLERTVGEPLVHPVSMMAGIAFLLGLALLVLGRTRYLTRWRRMQQGQGILSAGPVMTVALATVLLGASALFVVLARAFG
jgi:uncharacterized membrane protein YidH (DUF202 family)